MREQTRSNSSSTKKEQVRRSYFDVKNVNNDGIVHAENVSNFTYNNKNNADTCICVQRIQQQCPKKSKKYSIMSQTKAGEVLSVYKDTADNQEYED